MAENLLWIAAQYSARTRILVWGHDSHVERGVETMGAFLARHFGSDYLVLSTAFYSGSYLADQPQGFRSYRAAPAPPGSVEAMLHRLNDAPMLLDLVRPRNDPMAAWLWQPREVRRVGTRAAEPGFVVTKLREAVDGILFVDSSTPAWTLEPPLAGRGRE